VLRDAFGYDAWVARLTTISKQCASLSAPTVRSASVEVHPPTSTFFNRLEGAFDELAALPPQPRIRSPTRNHTGKVVIYWQISRAATLELPIVEYHGSRNPLQSSTTTRTLPLSTSLLDELFPPDGEGRRHCVEPGRVLNRALPDVRVAGGYGRAGAGFIIDRPDAIRLARFSSTTTSLIAAFLSAGNGGAGVWL